MSIHLARYLRQKGLSVRHVAEINPALPDAHIEFLMLPSDVLLTRDRDFYKQLGKDRAIYCAINTKRRRKPFAWYLTLKESLSYEQANGISDFKLEIAMSEIFCLDGDIG